MNHIVSGKSALAALWDRSYRAKPDIHTLFRKTRQTASPNSGRSRSGMGPTTYKLLLPLDRGCPPPSAIVPARNENSAGKRRKNQQLHAQDIAQPETVCTVCNAE